MRRTLHAGLWVFFFLSGATGLLYEIVWMRQLILVFGSTTHAVSAVLSAFMLGLALGSFAFGRAADRGANLVRLYGILEIGVGLYALVAPFLLAKVAPLFVRALGTESAPGALSAAARFAGSLLILVPPTILMGGTLPVLSRLFSAPGTDHAGPVGRLYAVNTSGAVVGTLVTGFALLPGLGMHRTTLLAAAVNVGLGLLAIGFSASEAFAPGALAQSGERAGDRPGLAGSADDHMRAAAGASQPGPSRAMVLTVFALSGFAAMLCEVGWTRVLSLTLGSSVYAFTLMLAAFLTGLASGAALFARLASRPGANSARMLAWVLTGVGGVCWATSLIFHELPYLFARIYSWTAPSIPLQLTGQMALCLLIMFPATFLMGGIFPLVLSLHARREREVGRRVGEAYASNTIGTVFGAAAAGFLFVPTFGVRATLLVAIAMDLLLASALVAAAGSRWRAVLAPAGAAALAAGLFLLSPAWDPLMMHSGLYLSAESLKPGFTRAQFKDLAVGRGEVLYYKEGPIASVMVAREGGSKQIYLKVNGKTEATSMYDLDTQVLVGQLPFLFHPDPRTAFVIGLGSGITVTSVASHDLESIRVVEVEPAMGGAARCFDKENKRVLDDPRVHVVYNDARNDLLMRDETYDIIVGEPSNPWMTVASNLFTRDFFLAAKTRLKPGGVFAQWVQTYSLAAEDLQCLVKTYRSVFPNVLMFSTGAGLSDLVLIGSDRSLPLDYGMIQERMSGLPVAMDFSRARIRRPEDIFALLLLAPPGLDGYLEGAPINTDENARIEFSAPLSLHRSSVTETANLMYPHRLALPGAISGIPVEPAERRQFLMNLAEGLLRNDRMHASLDVLAAAETIAVDDHSRNLHVAIEKRRAQL